MRFIFADFAFYATVVTADSYSNLALFTSVLKFSSKTQSLLPLINLILSSTCCLEEAVILNSDSSWKYLDRVLKQVILKSILMGCVLTLNWISNCGGTKTIGLAPMGLVV